MTALQTLSATLILASTTACGPPDPAQMSPSPWASDLAVTVTNHNWSDMVVYRIRGGFRQRLGMVTSMSTQTFEVPGGFASSLNGLRLEADPIGSDNIFSTGQIQVSPGQKIQFTIENHLAISNYSVWDH